MLIENKRVQDESTIWLYFAFGFLFVYMWFYTDSLWIASTGMAMVGISIAVGAFWMMFFLRIVFNCGLYFPATSIFGLFILLGVGADDVFVMFDGVRQ